MKTAKWAPGSAGTTGRAKVTLRDFFATRVVPGTPNPRASSSMSRGRRSTYQRVRAHGNETVGCAIPNPNGTSAIGGSKRIVAQSNTTEACMHLRTRRRRGARPLLSLEQPEHRAAGICDQRSLSDAICTGHGQYGAAQPFDRFTRLTDVGNVEVHDPGRHGEDR